eukprot:1175572-Prorocentrum_minimum.AAC.4
MGPLHSNGLLCNSGGVKAISPVSPKPSGGIYSINILAGCGNRPSLAPLFLFALAQNTTVNNRQERRVPRDDVFEVTVSF